MGIKRYGDEVKPYSLPDYKFRISSPVFRKKGEDFNIEFYEGVLKKNPNLVECLNYLGNAYTAKGMYQEGLEIDKKLSKLRPEDAVIIYNLACSYSLTHEINLAISTLTKAIVLGYDDVEQIESDSDMSNIRNDKRYKCLMDMLRKKSEGVIV